MKKITINFTIITMKNEARSISQIVLNSKLQSVGRNFVSLSYQDDLKEKYIITVDCEDFPLKKISVRIGNKLIFRDEECFSPNRLLTEEGEAIANLYSSIKQTHVIEGDRPLQEYNVKGILVSSDPGDEMDSVNQ